MEDKKADCSTYYVPGAMSDITIMNTPLPQAASTATKSRSVADDDLLNLSDGFYGKLDAFHNKKSSTASSSTQLQQLIKLNEKHLPATKSNVGSTLQLYNEFSDFTDNMFAIPSIPKTSRGANGKTPQKKSSTDTKTGNLLRSSDNAKNASLLAPSKTFGDISPRKNYNIDIKKSPKKSNFDSSKSVSLNESGMHSFLRDRFSDTPAKLPATRKGSKDPSDHRKDRLSVTSSLNSSLGVIPSDILTDAQREPLTDITQDLSLRLAEKLNLDSSLLKDGGLDISALAGERYREKVAAKCESKENLVSARHSSDYWTLHGYSSDNSVDSKNNTAKRLSSLSSSSGGDSKLDKSFSPSRLSLNLPREMADESLKLSPKSRSSFGSNPSNPFGSYNNISVNSEDFQFSEDASQRLDRDERQFSMSSARSLSGIYGDADAVVNVNGQRLSMSSFLRSGSGPLGCLEGGREESGTLRPQFGMAARSPEKTGKPRAILPPPQEKPTFVLEEEEPVRDTPWLPHSLAEQYSNIHGTDVTGSDMSVPSLSLIGDMLEKLRQGADHKDVLDQLMGTGSQSNVKNDPNESITSSRISSVVEGENSFCRGVDGNISALRDKSILHKSTVEASWNKSATSSSICNITDFEGDEDSCVCVLTPQSMDFDVFNELSHPVEYNLSKACYVDNQRQDSAAYVHFPVPKLVLFPGQKRTLTISIAALVKGVIKIKIQVVRTNPLTKERESSNVYGMIVAEIPQISLLTLHEGNMVLNPETGYDGKYQHTIVMMNEGRCQVPLKLTLTNVMSEKEVLFHFGERGKQCVTVMLEPGQMFRQLVECETPPIFDHHQPKDTVTPAKAIVEFSLTTTELYQLNPVAPVTLIAHIKPYFFGAPHSLLVPSNLKLFNGSDEAVVFRTTSTSGYVAKPSSFTVPPNQAFVLCCNLSVDSDMTNPLSSGELILHIVFPPSLQTQFAVKLMQNQNISLSPKNSLDTPIASRCSSPSSFGGSTLFPGELKVVCSHKQLVWGGCPMHQRVVKAFWLKNKGSAREKLRLTISDDYKGFKLVNEDNALVPELKISLQPMDNKEVKVAVLATGGGPLWGRFTVSRIGRPQDKKLLPLYAFGGRSNLALHQGVIEIESKKFIFLDDRTLESTIVLKNKGDSCAFFRISEANSTSSAGLSISPAQCLLPAGQTASVRIGLLVTEKRLEYLLRQTSTSVRVAELSIHHGDESTRQRLLRTKGLQGVLATRVMQLSSIPSTPIPNLQKIDVPPAGAESLWVEDTDEWMVGVFINRAALEGLRLDTSVEFVDLSTTIIEH